MLPAIKPTTAADPAPPSLPALPASEAAEETPEATPTFWVGDYEVGDGYFSELSGHPDIIY
ncbi:hypothetical protein Q5H92_16490 [Hymenobacter sp. M29]|uniref:Uncharacterized protein n=1 Tax=Hymenobacter mellowenesis TaxID=3063995 RepID=A0ABT9ADQ5_9BACT|nr:hypothetical protein [Hymenobacter sp. M29]MDO7847966.1 hypothetical protein [Hymenobacter sp. M29]